MRRDVKLSISLGALLVLGLLLAPAGAGKTRSTVILRDADPIVVTGRSFKPRERVALRTTIRGRLFRKSVVATRTGSFTVQLANVDAECSPFIVYATGNAGSRAQLRRINIPPPCGIPIAP